MATAEELLSATSETSDDVLSINLNTRIISIPAKVSVLGVESDDDVHRLRFNIPRYYGDIDLSEFDVRVNFKPSRGSEDFYVVDDKTVSDTDDTISFSWLVDRSAFMYPGDVTFSICMKKYDDEGLVINEFNSTTATLPVLKGLETEKAVIENNPSAFDSILVRLYAIEAANGLGKDGYYSIVQVTENDDGVLFNIINQNGIVEAVVKHGKTPERGVDYFTEEDENNFKTELKQYIDQWSPSCTTINLPAVNWVNYEQTISVDKVTPNSIVYVSPDYSELNYTEYTENAVRCISQGDGTLTFGCDALPAIDVVVNVSVHYINTES